MLSCFSHVRLFVTLWSVACQAPWDSPGKNAGVGCHALLRGIFPSQGLNPDLLHCRQIFLPTELQGKPPKECWSGLPCPPPGDLPEPGADPRPPRCRRVLYRLSHGGQDAELAPPVAALYCTQGSCACAGFIPICLQVFRLRYHSRDVTSV